jgi:hypothetical protein
MKKKGKEKKGFKPLGALRKLRDCAMLLFRRSLRYSLFIIRGSEFLPTSLFIKFENSNVQLLEKQDNNSIFFGEV